jgi:16S rRNA (uracil1498-N3)-methyltransferase
MRPPVAAHVLVDDLSDPVLSPDDAHHLATVLRLRAGEAVGATDGRGGYLACVWAGSGVLEPSGAVEVEPPSGQPVGVGFVPVKGDRPEWVVQKLTELGVEQILLLRSERSVVRWDGERAVSQLNKLKKVAKAALMQSRQVWLPRVSGMLALIDVVTGPSVALADFDGDGLGSRTSTVLIGPEGGWSDRERQECASVGAGRIGLGPTVLRAETAALSAGVLLTSLRDGRVAPGRPDRSEAL